MITSDVERWVNTMLQEEHGIPLKNPKPLKAAMVTFSAFVLVGALPLLPFLWNWLTDFLILEPFQWSALSAAQKQSSMNIGFNSNHTGILKDRVAIDHIIKSFQSVKGFYPDQHVIAFCLEGKKRKK